MIALIDVIYLSSILKFKLGMFDFYRSMEFVAGFPVLGFGAVLGFAHLSILHRNNELEIVRD